MNSNFSVDFFQEVLYYENMTMKIEPPSQGTCAYADSIDFLEASITTQLQEINCDLMTADEISKRQIFTNVEKVIREYDAYTEWAIQENPYYLKEIQQLRESKQFWIDFRNEQLNTYD